MPATNFIRVPRAMWRLSSACSSARVRRLWSPMTFETIVRRMIAEVTLVQFKRERARNRRQYFRVCITLRCTQRTVDSFHNGASGYRAQYFKSRSNGDRANRYLLNEISERVMYLMLRHPKRSCPFEWARTSLVDPDAKVWIYQGLWLRYPKTTDGQLLVPRWVREQQNSDSNRRKKARYAGLMPSRECRVEIMGGFVTLRGKSLGTLKPERARDLNELGFT